MRTLLVLALVSAPVIARADERTDAQALFDLGIQQMKEGKLDDACRHLAASLAKLPDSGTKGALAVCRTKQGKLATAWTLWRDLAVTAPTDTMKASAARAAKELEPRLARYQLAVKPLAGLVVKINDATADLSVDVPLPVDPGKVTIVASAPDHRDYTSEATAIEGQVVQIDIPALVALPRPTRPEPPALPPPASRAAAKRDWVVIGLAAAGGASLVAGAVFGMRARSLWNDAEKACGDIDACPGDVFASAKDKYAAARTSATVSTLLVGIGAAAAVGGGVLWYVRRGKPPERTAIAPLVAGDGLGVALIGSFP